MGNIWWLYHPSSFTAALTTLNNFVEPFVERAAMQDGDSLQDKQQAGQAMNFTDSLSQFTKDRQVLRDQLVNALIAGRDTTAACLSWLFLELSYRPDLYAKLREEVLSTLSNDAKPTYEDLKNMKFLQHCLNEGQYSSHSILITVVLRLYPIVPFNVRTALVDTTLPRGGGPAGLDVPSPTGNAKY